MALNDATLANVIADVGATVRQVLREHIADLMPAERVVFASPADIDITTEPRLGVFLYQVLESAEMRNQPPEPEGLSGMRYSQTVDLFYLITPYTQQLEDAHRLLGQVMRVFVDHAVLHGSLLQGSLADIGQALRLLLHPITIEELNRLWGLFPNRPYRLSLAYQVTPVKIVGSLRAAAGRVITRQVDYAQVLERR
ncbi:MAG: DUF4255 domain-containing protein [Candidatus Tectimicrobiota bacterium]